MDLVQQSVKVSAKIHCQCSNPNEQKVKLLHYHVHPFTSRQVLAFYFCCKKRIPYYVIFRGISTLENKCILQSRIFIR